MERTLSFLLVLLVAVMNLQAQKLSVESMELSPMDISASIHPRNDRNGNPCGLVKVRLAAEGAAFSGNVLGEVTNHEGEYWVYMSEGSYMLQVRHPKFLALDVNFRDHGIRGVQPKTTYELTLLMQQTLSTIAGGAPLKVNTSFNYGFDRGGYPENVMGLLSTLPQQRLGRGSGMLEIYRNLKNSRYDQLYTIRPDGLLNNVNAGDVLTIFTRDKSFKSLSVTITDSIIKSGEIKLTLEKERSSLQGYVIDDFTHKPVRNCTVLLYLGNCQDDSGNSLFRGYERYFETGESFGEYFTKENGFFGWNNCISDYTYYISAKPPRGYARINCNKGVDMKPKDNKNDSLIITIKPCIVQGIVTDGKDPIPDVEIECETLYGKKNLTTGQDGSFEIMGLSSEFIRFKHDDFRIMDVKFEDYYLHENNIITIKMRKGNKKSPFKGEYKWGKIKETE